MDGWRVSILRSHWIWPGVFCSWQVPCQPRLLWWLSHGGWLGMGQLNGESSGYPKAKRHGISTKSIMSMENRLIHINIHLLQRYIHQFFLDNEPCHIFVFSITTISTVLPGGLVMCHLPGQIGCQRSGALGAIAL